MILLSRRGGPLSSRDLHLEFHASLAELLGVVAEYVEELRGKWEQGQLPKLQARARKHWREARRAGGQREAKKGTRHDMAAILWPLFFPLWPIPPLLCPLTSLPSPLASLLSPRLS